MLQSTASVFGGGGVFNFRICHFQRKTEGDSDRAMVAALKPNVLITRPSLVEVELNPERKPE